MTKLTTKSDRLVRVGAHVSSAGGAKKFLQRVDDLEVEAVQIHPSAPQTYRQTSISVEDRALIKKTLKDKKIPLYFHSIYLINLANEDDRLWHASIGAVKHYLEIAPQFGAIGTVTHVGSHKGKGLKAVEERLAKAAGKIAQEAKGPLGKFLIENTAGGGGTLGRDLAELAVLYKIFSKHLDTGICLDTCHLFASGVPLNDESLWQEWLENFDREIGLDKVVTIHLNDSKTPFGSNRDRHQNIGEGEIGLDVLARVVREPKLAHCDFILEVPGVGQGPDLLNINRVKKMRG